LPVPTIQIICRRLMPEHERWVTELRAKAIVYSFPTTRDLLAASRLAKDADSYELIAPNGVVWLQSRPGEFFQAEIDAVAIADPLAKPFLIAGTLCEGEPRSGRLLVDVTRLYWHESFDSFWSLLLPRTEPTPATQLDGQWLAIHASTWTDYQGLAGVCHSLGIKTVWQNDRWPIVSSEPAYRVFHGWPAWQAWRERPEPRSPKNEPARAILLLDFPRHEDFNRAYQDGIASVLACPFRAEALQRALLPKRIRQPARATAALKVTRPAPAYSRAG
jgi:hypothetical protein